MGDGERGAGGGQTGTVWVWVDGERGGGGAELYRKGAGTGGWKSKRS